jgi:hypothetical protein
VEPDAELKRLPRALPPEPDRDAPDDALNRLLYEPLLEPYERGAGAGLGRGGGGGGGGARYVL